MSGTSSWLRRISGLAADDESAAPECECLQLRAALRRSEDETARVRTELDAANAREVEASAQLTATTRDVIELRRICDARAKKIKRLENYHGGRP